MNPGQRKPQYWEETIELKDPSSFPGHTFARYEGVISSSFAPFENILENFEVRQKKKNTFPENPKEQEEPKSQQDLFVLKKNKQHA